MAEVWTVDVTVTVIASMDATGGVDTKVLE